MRSEWIFWLIVALAGTGLVVALVLYLSAESRLRRRRRKSHSRIISKANRPSVKFSVRPPEE